MYLSSIEFAKAVGVTPQTVREWHKRGWVIPVKLTISGRRLYSQEQIDAFKSGDYDSEVLKGHSLNGVSDTSEQEMQHV